MKPLLAFALGSRGGHQIQRFPFAAALVRPRLDLPAALQHHNISICVKSIFIVLVKDYLRAVLKK